MNNGNHHGGGGGITDPHREKPSWYHQTQHQPGIKNTMGTNRFFMGLKPSVHIIGATM